MNIIDNFTLQQHHLEHQERPLKSVLYYCGEPIKEKVPGYIIEQQFELTDYFLLFISWDCPFEEGCEVIVLNKLKKIVACYSFNGPYNSYHLMIVTEQSKNNFKLLFNQSDNFSLCINYPKKYFFCSVIKVRKLDE